MPDYITIPGTTHRVTEALFRRMTGDELRVFLEDSADPVIHALDARIAELEREVEDAEGRAQTLEEERDELDIHCAALENDLRRCEEERDELDIHCAALENDLRRCAEGDEVVE